MAKNIRLSSTAADLAASGLLLGLNNGTVSLYGGIRPESPETMVTDQLLLGVLYLGDPAFKAPSGGVAQSNPIKAESAAPNTGKATWFRVRNSNGMAMFDGNIGTEDADMILNTVEVTGGATINIRSISYVQFREGQ